MKAATWIQDVAYSGNGEEEGRRLRGWELGTGPAGAGTVDGEVVPSGRTLAYRAALGAGGTHTTIALHFFSSSLLPAKKKLKLKGVVELSSATNCLLQRGQTR